VVNHWMGTKNLFGRGGATFLSGSITTAIRNVYGGMLGFRPTLAGLVVNPTIPALWEHVSYQHNYRGARFDVTIENPRRVESGVAFMELDGKRITGSAIPRSMIRGKRAHKLRVVLG
jgi:cellobiose phosphorylase